MQKDLPLYASAPLLGFLDYWEESFRLLHLCMGGISMITGVPRIVEVLKPFENDLKESAASEAANKKTLSMEEARAKAGFAQKECDSGFPLLHAHTLVGAWGALEAAIEDMIVGILANEPEFLQAERFAKVRIPLAEFESLEKDERIRFLIAELERGQGLGAKHGIDVFENLLDRIGLSGEVDPQTKKDTWEIHHLRNVIVHRASFADRRLVRSCPWLDLKLGQKVVITHGALGSYGDAMCKYILTIAHRLGKRYGVDVEEKIRLTLDAKSA
jgi:hypothetical protein